MRKVIATGFLLFSAMASATTYTLDGARLATKNNESSITLPLTSEGEELKGTIKGTWTSPYLQLGVDKFESLAEMAGEIKKRYCGTETEVSDSTFQVRLPSAGSASFLQIAVKGKRKVSADSIRYYYSFEKDGAIVKKNLVLNCLIAKPRR